MIVATTVKVKGGGAGVIKADTKVRGIRLISDGVGDHDIDANVPDLSRLQLKSSVVKEGHLNCLVWGSPVVREPRVCVMAVDSGSAFWLRSLLAGRFRKGIRARLYGTAGPRRLEARKSPRVVGYAASGPGGGHVSRVKSLKHRVHNGPIGG